MIKLTHRAIQYTHRKHSILLTRPKKYGPEAANLENPLVGSIGLEPTTPTMSRWCSNQLSYDALAPVAISLKNALEAPKERHSKGSALKNQDLGHMASSRAFFSRLAQGASAKTV